MGVFCGLLHPGCTWESPGDSDLVGLGGPWALVGKFSRYFQCVAGVENTHLSTRPLGHFAYSLKNLFIWLTVPPLIDNSGDLNIYTDCPANSVP